jgi:quinoprotein glucose dehydrogenase
MKMKKYFIKASLLTFFVLIWGCDSTSLQISDWATYGGDKEGSRYSPLTQINKENVKNQKVAWIYHTRDADK